MIAAIRTAGRRGEGMGRGPPGSAAGSVGASGSL
jgi:hypothetical protein